MIRNVDLLGHLPLYVQNYREIQAIMNVENPELQAVEDDSEQVKNNMFIKHTNESGIARYEKMLGVTSLNDDKLEDRQAEILSIYNNNVIYTYKGLIERLKILCGEDNFTTSLIANEYRLYVKIGLSSKKVFKTVESMLKDMLPANIDWSLDLLCNTHEMLSHLTHGELSAYTHKSLREDVFTF